MFDNPQTPTKNTSAVLKRNQFFVLSCKHCQEIKNETYIAI